MNKGETMKDKELKPFDKLVKEIHESRELYLLRESFTMIIDMLLKEDEKVNIMPSGTLKDEFLKIQESAWTALLRDKDFQKITTEE
jgi:hypothetical protein